MQNIVLTIPNNDCAMSSMAFKILSSSLFLLFQWLLIPMMRKVQSVSSWHVSSWSPDGKRGASVVIV